MTALLYGESGEGVDKTQGAAVLSTITQAANAYTRGRGFTNGLPCPDVYWVILTAAARLIAHPRQLAVDQAEGQDSVSWRGGFNGWSVVETFALDRYRIRAR